MCVCGGGGVSKRITWTCPQVVNTVNIVTRSKRWGLLKLIQTLVLCDIAKFGADLIASKYGASIFDTFKLKREL